MWRYCGSPIGILHPPTALAALDEEKCTHMPAVPAMIQALLANPGFDINKTRSLHSVCLSGALVRLLSVEMCKTGFGTEPAIPTFGMTEGVNAFL